MPMSIPMPMPICPCPFMYVRAVCITQDRMESLEAEYGRVQEDYDAAAKRFGEDPTKSPSGEFFNLVSVMPCTVYSRYRVK